MQNVPQHVVATIDPATVASSAPGTSDGIDLSHYHDVTFLVLLGDIANETVTITVQKDTVSNFASAETHSQIVLAADASDNDNIQRAIEVEAREVDQRYVRLHVVTGSTSGGPMSAVAVATPRFSDMDELATVTRT